MYLIFCKQNNSAMSEDGSGGRMAAFSFEDKPLIFPTIEEAEAFYFTQSEEILEKYEVRPATECFTGPEFDKSGWPRVQMKGLREFAKSQGITDMRMFRNLYSHIAASVQQGNLFEADRLFTQCKQSQVVSIW